MPPVDEPMSFEPGQSRAEARKPKTSSSANARRSAAEPSPGADLVALTVDASAGRIVKVEGVDASGARHDLSDDEKSQLAKTEVGATLQGIIEEAFEAGLACALGERGDETDTSESEEDAELSRTSAAVAHRAQRGQTLPSTRGAGAGDRGNTGATGRRHGRRTTRERRGPLNAAPIRSNRSL